MVLTTDNGANRTDAFDGVRWDDEANEPVSRYDFRGSATPAALTPEGALGIFRGEDSNGTWTIEIIDDTEADDGELAGWSIEIVPTLPEPPTERETTSRKFHGATRGAPRFRFRNQRSP